MNAWLKHPVICKLNTWIWFHSLHSKRVSTS